MKKKEILIIFLVLLLSILSLWAFNRYSINSKNNSTSDNNSTGTIKSSLKSELDSSTGKSSTGPTIVDNKMDNEKDVQSTLSPSTGSTTKTETATATTGTSLDKKADNNSTTSSNASKVDYSIYEVQKDETLISICKKYIETCPSQILSKAIIDANKLAKSTDIKAGMKIKLPTKYINGGSKYTVKAGDTLYDLSVAYLNNMELDAALDLLSKDNFLKDTTIMVGQELFFSSIDKLTEKKVDMATSTNASLSTTTKNELIAYKINKEETLSTIAKKYEKNCPPSIVAKILLKSNNFTDSNDLKEGISINIPEKYLLSGEKYTIKSGDTLSKIALDYFKDIDLFKAIEKIQKDNFMTSSNIRMGDTLFITAIELN